jgi:hypothetical protein
MRALIVIALFVVCAVNAVSQQPSTQTKTQAIAAAFNKHKNVVKEKYGVRTEKYKDVRSEPVVKNNIGDYFGVYEVAELGSVINIQVGSDGRVQAGGYEKTPQSRTFKRSRMSGSREHYSPRPGFIRTEHQKRSRECF